MPKTPFHRDRSAKTTLPGPMHAARAAVGCLALMAAACGAQAAEFFVSKQGKDSHDGTSRQQAFLTIQRGLDALKPGDTLTIGPGEYLESASRKDLGSPDAETTIRAEVPGTAVLRGDVPAPEFRPVKGYRYVHAATFEQTPHAVLEHHELRTLLPAPTVSELEFDPGKFHYDPASKTLSISNAKLVDPGTLRYTVAVSGKAGLELTNPRRVTIDGLAACGFYPGWCINLNVPVACIVRNCVLSQSVGGIRLGPDGQVGQAGGSKNIVEHCTSFGHTFGGIVCYGANDDVIRNNHTFRSFREGQECFGVMHYARMFGPLKIADNISWGQSFDYSVKPVGQERLERNVGLGFIRNANMAHNLIGGGNEYDRGATSTPPDNILFKREQPLDQNAEFADHLNLDFRLQPESRFRTSAPDGSDRGPYAYEPNVFYVSPGGDDAADGLSLKKPWKTLKRGLEKARPGDTLYLTEGEYAAADSSRLGDGTKPIRILGRGRGRVVVTGAWAIADAALLRCERLHFAGPVTVATGKDVAFENCTFFTKGPGGGLFAKAVAALSVKHCDFVDVPLDLGKSTGVLLGGNIHSGKGPAVRLASADGLRHADHDAYPSAERAWQVGDAIWPLSEVQRRHEQHARVIAAKFAVDRGVPRLENAAAFRSLGPHNSTIGIHHDYDPTPDAIQIVGPFVFSAHDTTANIEWWSTHPATYTIAWGDTPEMKNTIENVPGPQRFNTYSLSGLEPGKTYHFAIRKAKATGLDSVDPLPELRPTNASVSFTTAKAAVAPRTWHVAPDGDDDRDGLSRPQAFRTLNRAAVAAGPGDTVLIAGGDYVETVRIRAAGTPERPITFRAAPGERPVIRGESLARAFEVHEKPDIRFDGIHFRGFDMFSSGILVRNSPRFRVERCMNTMVTADNSPGIVIRNCVLRGGWSAAGLGRCPDAVVENNVFVMTILRHISCEGPATVRNNVFYECIRGKGHQTLLELGSKVKESNNCFLCFWPEDEKLTFNNRPLTEYRLRTGSDTITANPMCAGVPGWRQGWQQVDQNADFDRFFAANPLLVARGIGLEPEAFRDTCYDPAKWPYDKAWADGMNAAIDAAAKLARDGKEADALQAYLDIVAKRPVCDRLKADLLERASHLAQKLGRDEQAMELAKAIPVEVLAMRRQMQLLLAQGRHAEVLDTFADKKMGGRSFSLSYTYPEQEDVMADLYDGRAQAHLAMKDVAAAEADLRVMNDKRAKIQCRSGEAIHDRAWLRLGDFYRDQLHDEARALEAYLNVCDRTTWDYWGRPRKPAARGADQTLVAATDAACAILERQGKKDEVQKLRVNLLEAKAAAAAGALDRKEMLARFAEVLAIPGLFSAEHTAVEKQLESLEPAARNASLARVGPEAAGLSEDVRSLLLESVRDGDAADQRTALRTLIRFAPAEKIGATVQTAAAEARKQAVQSSLEPKIRRLRELTGAKEWQKLVAEFKAVDFATWEDANAASSALHLRGMAYYRLKQGKRAEADMKKSLELASGEQPELWYWLAENYQQILKDDGRALEAYKKAGGRGGLWATYDANLKAAAILVARKQNDEALKILRSAEIDAVTGVWREKTLAALESVLASMGRGAEAAAEYRRVLALPNVTPAEKAAFEKRLAALGAGK